MTGSPGIVPKSCIRCFADGSQQMPSRPRQPLRSQNPTLAPFIAEETGDAEISPSKLKLSANGMPCYTHGTGEGHAILDHFFNIHWRMLSRRRSWALQIADADFLNNISH